MFRYILRRLFQSIWTILGVMIITFLLFRVVSGDIAASFKGAKATEEDKAVWRHKHGYDRPGILNVHNRLRVEDRTKGPGVLMCQDGKDSKIVNKLALTLEAGCGQVRRGRYLLGLDEKTRVRKLTDAPDQKMLDKQIKPRRKMDQPPPPERFEMIVTLSNQDKFTIDLEGVTTAGELMQRINDSAGSRDALTGERKLLASVEPWKWTGIWRSQFIDHLYKSMTFQAKSLKQNKKLTTIIRQRAPKSLALTIPAMGLGLILGLAISSFVAYFRGTRIDKIGVFLSVLGMCVPFLAIMIYAQWFMFKISPRHAFGLEYRANIYVPIFIMVLAGLGARVRFYRTVILDETNRDYVRTARAKGVSLPNLLFKHVLKNCMLPILTQLILAIPFLIMGSMLVEMYFGTRGLGDLRLSSIEGRDEPIIAGLVFLTALIYTLGLLVTDIMYAVFDPRIRLR